MKVMFLKLKWNDWFKIHGPRSIYIYSLIIGIVAGLGAVAFATALAYVEHITFDYIAGIPRTPVSGEVHFESENIVAFNRLAVLLLPAFGGLLVGLFTTFINDEVKGNGTDSMIRAFHHNEGRVRGINSIHKAIVTIFSLATGGSGGKEGPTAQIGSGFGSTLANFLKAGARARRTLLLAGTAGGLGAIFRAPFGGAMTAVEVVYREDIESDSLVPAIISSVTAYLVYTTILGSGTVFHLADVRIKDYREILVYVILGLVTTGGGYLFTKIYRKVEFKWEGMSIPPYLKPALGGLAVGVIGQFVPEAMGAGFGVLQNVLDGNPPVRFTCAAESCMVGAFLLVAFMKILTTSFTIATGGSAGVFGPSLFIGGMLGGAAGTTAQILFPELDLSVRPFILVGMASFFAGVANAPIAGMIMVSDMVGNYSLLPALMIVSIISVILSHQWSIYKGQIINRFQSPAHYWDMRLDILDKLTIFNTITEFRNKAVSPGNILLAELEDRMTEYQATDFVVKDRNDEYLGMLSLRKTRLASDIQIMRTLILVQDAADASIPAVSITNTLGDALRIIMEHEMDKVAVIRDRKVIGYIRYNDIFTAYHHHVRRKD